MSNHKNVVKTREPSLLKFLKYGIYLVAFIPLVIFSQYISPFHFGKVFVFRTLIEVLGVLYVVLLIKNGKQFLPPRTRLFWAISIFTAAFGLATFFSINFYQSFFGTLERMGGWFSFFHFWLFCRQKIGGFGCQQQRNRCCSGAIDFGPHPGAT